MYSKKLAEDGVSSKILKNLRKSSVSPSSPPRVPFIVDDDHECFTVQACRDALGLVANCRYAHAGWREDHHVTLHQSETARERAASAYSIPGENASRARCEARRGELPFLCFLFRASTPPPLSQPFHCSCLNSPLFNISLSLS